MVRVEWEIWTDWLDGVAWSGWYKNKFNGTLTALKSPRKHGIYVTNLGYKKLKDTFAFNFVGIQYIQGKMLLIHSMYMSLYYVYLYIHIYVTMHKYHFLQAFKELRI